MSLIYTLYGTMRKLGEVFIGPGSFSYLSAERSIDLERLRVSILCRGTVSILT